MDEADTLALLNDISDVVKALLDKTVTPLVERIDGLERQIRDIPVPRDGVDADPEKVCEIVLARVAPDLKSLKDDLGAITPQIESFAAQMSDKINGEIAAQISRGFEALPKAVDGKDADPEAVAEIVSTKIEPKIKEITDNFATINTEVRRWVEEGVGQAKTKMVETAGQIELLQSTNEALISNLSGFQTAIEEIRSSVQDKVKEAVACIAIPAPAPGKDADPALVAELVDAAVAKAIAAIPVAKDGVGLAGSMIDRNGHLMVTMTNGQISDLGEVNGKDAVVDTAALDTMVAKHVAEAAAGLTSGRDGTDVDMVVVKAMVLEEVRAGLAAIPVVEPAKPVTAEDLLPLISTEVTKAVQAIEIPEAAAIDFGAIQKMIDGSVALVVDQIPVPANGKDADLDVVKTWIDDAVAKIPVPANGKDADPAVIEKAVNDAVAALPKPVDGKDVDIDTVKVMVDEAVAKIPAPADGKSVDIGEVTKLLSDMVAALPVAKDGADGKDIDPESVKAMVEDAVAKIPAPKDGKSVEPAEIMEMVKAGIATLPVPRDGLDADPEQIKTLVKEAVAALPTPKDGKDVDPEFVKSLVEKAVAEIPVPKDGRDADPEAIKAAVQAAVSEIPAPKDGRSVTLDEIAPLVEHAVTKAVAEIPVPKDGESVDPVTVAEMVDSKVNAAMALVPKPMDGADGKSVSIEDVKPLIEAAVAGIPGLVKEAVAAVPAPKDGADGKSVTLEDVTPVIQEAVSRIPELVKAAVAEIDIPVPADGKDVDPAAVKTMVEEAVAKLPVPKDGRDVDQAAVEAAAKAEVERLVAAIPVPADGKSVGIEDVAPVIQEAVQKAVAAIPAPVSTRDVIIDQDGQLVATLSDGSTKTVGKVKGADADMESLYRRIDERIAEIPKPKDGIDGKDGLGFDDATLADTENGFMLRLARGDEKKDLRLPINIYRGVFKEGKKYFAGDSVTWDGSSWIAKVDTTAKPKSNDDWQLGVKRGQDGKSYDPSDSNPPPKAPIRFK